MTSVSTLSALLLMSSCCIVAPFDIATIDGIRGQIRQLIDQKKALFGGFARLAFHDCVGNRCDGCINHAESDNKGLSVYTDILENMYSTLEVDGVPVTGMSRADFWALAGIEAVTHAANFGRNPVIPDIEFKYGREDCPTSPVTTESHQFPNALQDTKHVLDFFAEQFNFNEMEATAILGCHTLGQAHKDASGFVHPWVRGKDKLDNQFFVDLNDPSRGWIQRDIGPRDDKQWFWENSVGDGKFLMLNTDMALIRNLSIINDDGEVDCTYSTCPVANTQTVNWVQTFAADNNRWITELAKAFQKMIEKGWEGQLTSLGMTTTTILSTTTGGLMLPDVTSVCTNNKIRNPEMGNKKGYKGKKITVENKNDAFHGSDYFSYKCNSKKGGFNQKIKFKRSEVKEFTAALWSRLKVTESAVKTDSYSLKVIVKFVDDSTYEEIQRFDPSDSDWHRAMVRYSGSVNIKDVTVWARCEDKGRYAFFDEMAFLVDPVTCEEPM